MMRLSQRLILCFIGASIALLHCALAANDNSTWMANENVQAKKLMELTFPASHDAHTFGIKKRGIFKLKIHRGGRCQTQNITEQLNFGVRALDVRLNNCGEGKDFGTSHGLKSNVFKDILEQIIKFLKKNGSEIVFLKLKEDKKWFGRKMKMNKISEQVKQEIKCIKNKLKFDELKYVRITDLDQTKTVGEMVEEQTRLVLMYKEDVEGTYKQVKAKKPKTLISNVQKYAENLMGGEDNGKYRWLSMQVTNFAKALITPGGYKDMAAQSAKLAEDERVSKTLIMDYEDRRLFNFIGMDMHGENTQDVVNYIIDSNKQEGLNEEEFSRTLADMMDNTDDAGDTTDDADSDAGAPKNPMEELLLAAELNANATCAPSAPSAASAPGAQE